MIRDYWIYQQRQNEGHQWAIYVVKEFVRGAPELTVLDITLYSEDIGTPTNSKSVVGLQFELIRQYVKYIINELKEFTIVTVEDKEQLEREIQYILREN